MTIVLWILKVLGVLDTRMCCRIGWVEGNVQENYVRGYIDIVKNGLLDCVSKDAK